MKRKPLTEREVHKVCELLMDPTYRQVDIAIDLHIPAVTVSNILNGKSYRDISSQYKFPFRGMSSHALRIGNDVVHNICHLLQDTNDSFEEIANKTGASVSWIRAIYKGLERSEIASHYNFRERRDRRKIKSSTPISDELTTDICELLMDPTITYREISDVIGIPEHVVGKIFRHEITSDIIDNYSFPARIPGRRKVTTSKRITIEETHVEETVLSDEMISLMEENEQLKKENEKLRNEFKRHSAMEIDEELKARYDKADSDLNEIQILTKIIEEAGELIGEASGVVCEYTGCSVGTWKGKDKNYRQEFLHEWMDVYRLMQRWIEKFASDKEVDEMGKMNIHKIKKLVKMKENNC